ncbi:zf-MYND domain containing protein [Pyrenophora teres f. teres]|uniref:Zf-MYND domain containing protein n=1 Tax=Pyrenophora teres f. teres TaxID=97479 RepID=A0A6S6WHK3_9PLEO|nr:zf-MYND domain containing protein [Pyrenophora teres f. teres]
MPHPQKCSACKNIRYCSPVCQTTDWAPYKTVCKRYLTSLTQRPTDRTTRRILFFQPSAPKPAFYYLAFPTKNATPTPTPDLSPFFPTIPLTETKKLSFHNRYLPFFVQLTYDANPTGTRVLAENKALGAPFRGPVVVMVFDAEEGVGGFPLDVDTTVFRALAEYVGLWREYQGPVFVEQPQERYGEEELRRMLGESWRGGAMR